MGHIADITVAVMAVRAMDRDMTGREGQSADDGFEECALAGAIGTDEGHAFARVHRETEIPDGVAITRITDRELLDQKGRMLGINLCRMSLAMDSRHPALSSVLKVSRRRR